MMVTPVLSRNNTYSVEEIEAYPLSQEEQFDKHKANELNHLQANLTT